MIPVLHNHFFNIAANGLFPFIIVFDMLPAGRFCEHKQSHTVTGIQKVLRLGIMRGADRVDMQLFL
ncbi:hypothetical protein D3C80_1947280 [compost metagenome]